MTQTTYTSTNTSLQPISNFSLPTEKMLKYTIQVQTPQDIETSVIEIVHDGISIQETQVSHSLSNTVPIEFTTSIFNNTGRLLCQPRANSSVFTIQKEVVRSDLYSENTVSGRRIKSDEGVGVYFVNNANNMTIRQEGNNFFGNSADYITAGVMGPIVQKAELLGSTWESYNGAISVEQSPYTVVESSGQPKNCIYQKINVTPGQLYRLSGNAYFTSASVIAKQGNRGSNGEPAVFVGNGPGDRDYDIFFTDTAEETFEIFFTPTQEEVYVNIGIGTIGFNLHYQNISLRESGPFNTYDQTSGAMFIKWNAVTAPQSLLTFVSTGTNNVITINSANSIVINDSVCGPQYPINTLAFNYTSSGTQVTINGNSSFYTNATSLNGGIKQLIFNSLLEEFSYMSSPISNSVLVELTRV